MAEQEIVVKLVLDSNVKKEMDAAWKDTKVGTGKIKKEMSGTTKTVLKFVAAYASIQGLKAALGMMGKMATAASDLEEAQSKAMTVFRGHTDTLKRLTGELTTSYAMSRAEAFKYLGSVQDLLVPMGVARDRASELSGEVVKLSADLGSFNNLPTAQVMADIQSALVGNFETMKKYGVVLNEATVKAEAMRLGLFRGKGTVDAATKALVAYKLIVKGSSDAMGDMERTAESWANQQKQLTASWTDFMAGLGNFIINSELIKGALKKINKELQEMAEALFFTRDEAKIKAQSKILAAYRVELENYDLTINQLASSIKQFAAGEISPILTLEELLRKEDALRILRVEKRIVESQIKELQQKVDASKPKPTTPAKLTLPGDSIFMSKALAKEIQDDLAKVIEDNKTQAKDMSDWNISLKEAEAERRNQIALEQAETERRINEDLFRDIAAFHSASINIMLGSIGTLATANLDQEIASLNARKASDTAKLNSREAAGEKITELERNAALETTEIEKKAALEAFRIWKISALAEGGGAIFLEVIKSLSNPFLATAIGIAGGIQLGLIAATPPPAFAKGGDFVTNGAMDIRVGDNPGGRERVTVTPISSENFNGPKNLTIRQGDIIIQGNADSGTVRALKDTHEKQLARMKLMLQQLKAAGQLPR